MQLSSAARHEPSLKNFWGRLIVLVLTVLLVLLVRIPLTWADQALFAGILIACCIAVGRMSESRFVTSTLAIISVFCTLRYITWRWMSSIEYLNNSGWNVEKIGLISALLLLCAESYSVLILLLGYFQSARPLKRLPVAMPNDTSTWPSVDVYIPTYNEPLDVVRPTVLAAMGIDWPPDRLNVYLLDDGRRQQFKDFAAECGVGYITRSDNAHAKAGNINHALKTTKGEYVTIFDCDHIPTRSFLQLTMGWFYQDNRLAMVQTPHHFYSPDPFERNLDIFRTIPNEGALFYGVVQDGNDLWNAAFFCGSCAVIKREALEEIGGIAVETVTEDAHTALRLQRQGWNTAYIGIPQAAGLATGSLAAHVGQRIRWARGMVQILRTEFPLFAGGLSFAQRLCYLNCAIHYLYAIPRLIFVSAPLVYLLLGRSNLYGFVWEILAYAAPHLILSNMVNSRTQGDHRHSFWNEVYEMVLAPYILLPTTLALINPKWGKFNVTSKESVVEEGYFDWKIARPYLFLITLNLAAIFVAIPRYLTAGDPTGVLFVNVLWAVLNTLLLGACIAVSFESKQRRSATRVETNLTASLALAPDDLHHCRVLDISEGGLALRSERALHCTAGQRALVTIRAGDEEFRLQVHTIRANENRIHLRFAENSLAHQRAVTRLLYARADSWLDWGKDQSRDRILSSLVNVFGIGARGIWMLPSLLIKQQAKPKPQARKLAPAKAVVPPTALLVLLMLPFFHSRAQQIPDVTSDVTAVPVITAPESGAHQTFQDTQTFADLGRKSAIVLGGDKAEEVLSAPVPATKIVGSANLILHYTTGKIDGGNPLQLTVKFNDVEVGRIAIVPEHANPAEARFALPADLLVHDNTISFQLQRTCEVPCAQGQSALPWVRIEPSSVLGSSGIVLPVPNRLSLLPSPFFDPSVSQSVGLPVVFETTPDLAALKAAGILASWYGTLAGYRGSHFVASVGQLPKGNVILLAQPGGAIASQLGFSDGQNQSAPEVAVLDNPSDRYGKVLVLVSKSGDSLVQLAQFVSRHHFVEDTDRLSVSADYLSQPRSDSSQAPEWFSTDKPLPIARDLSDNLLHSRIGSPTSLYFRIAPDLDYGKRNTVPLNLAFRLKGLSGDDHVWVAIRLNNTFVTKRRFGPEDNKDRQVQSFAIPVSLLYASNTLGIEVTTDRLNTVVADPANIDLEILPTTTLDLENPKHFVYMPRLDLFAAAGYPFTSKVDGSETALVIPDYPTLAQMGLYLDALSFLSAQTGITATNFELLNAKDLGASGDRNFLVIGSTNDEGPFRAFEPAMAVIPANGHFELSDGLKPWQGWLSLSWLKGKPEMQSLSELVEQQARSKIFMQEFVSPFRADRSVLVMATRSDIDGEAYLNRLSEASKRGLIHGGLAVGDDNSFSSFSMGSRPYALGDDVSLTAAYGWLRLHLWLLALLIVSVGMILAGAWEKLLEHQAKRRLYSTSDRTLLLKAPL